MEPEYQKRLCDAFDRIADAQEKQAAAAEYAAKAAGAQVQLAADRAEGEQAMMDAVAAMAAGNMDLDDTLPGEFKVS